MEEVCGGIAKGGGRREEAAQPFPPAPSSLFRLS